ncbi:MAG: NAD(P)H-dependent oxidoreductase subunit E [Ignavibacteriota bacterium]
MFTAQELSEIESLKGRYENPQAILLPILWKIQEKKGWIDQEGMALAAEICNVPKSHVLGVVSFYTMYFEKPMGKHHVQVCTNVSCMLRGGEKIYSDLKSQLGCGHLERTSDGMFSLEEVECMGACGGAPMIAVGETFFEKVSSDEAKGIIDTIRTTNAVPEPKRYAQMPELSLE